MKKWSIIGIPLSNTAIQVSGNDVREAVKNFLSVSHDDRKIVHAYPPCKDGSVEVMIQNGHRLLVKEIEHTSTIGNIKRITIVKQNTGMDVVFVHTDLPSSFTYDASMEQCFKFDCTQGTGEDYCRKNFPGVAITLRGDIKEG